MIERQNADPYLPSLNNGSGSRSPRKIRKRAKTVPLMLSIITTTLINYRLRRRLDTGVVDVTGYWKEIARNIFTKN
jgi:hypothetical protein